MRILNVILSLILIRLSVASNVNFPSTSERKVSRQKRYVAFPEGSSFSVALCMTIGQIGNPDVNYLSYAINWGVAYDLPNETWVTQHAHGFKNKIIDAKAVMQRRFRRDLYEEVEILIDSMGYDGRECIMRALCESQKMLSNRIGTMEEELLKKIFSLPEMKLLAREHRDLQDYDRAYRRGRSLDDCSFSYPKCGFSLIALAFGKFSNPLHNFM